MEEIVRKLVDALVSCISNAADSDQNELKCLMVALACAVLHI